MFTGIIETTGIIKEVTINGSNKTFWVKSSISDTLKPDQSVCHDGVCLTVEEVQAGLHKVTAIDETLQKTRLSAWQSGSIINLERSLQLGTRLDGHIVLGHVDTTGVCTNISEKNGSWVFTFDYQKKFSKFLIEKGSVCLNGISLTVWNVKKKSFSIAIIPYTFEHTNISTLKKGDSVNLEFDLVGKYILRSLSLKKK